MPNQFSILPPCHAASGTAQRVLTQDQFPAPPILILPRRLVAQLFVRAVMLPSGIGVSTTFSNLLLITEQSLRPIDATPETVLEVDVQLAPLDVLGDGSPNNFGYGLLVDCGHGLEFLGLVSRQSNGHCFCWLHVATVPQY